MSITKTSTVFCDGDDCQRWVGETVGTAADSRRLARARGWIRRAGRDLCPPCANTTTPSPGDCLRQRYTELRDGYLA